MKAARSQPLGMILSVFTSRQRSDLATDISKLAKRTSADCAEFVRAADEALALYRHRCDEADLHEQGVKKLKDLKRNAELVANLLENIDWNKASVLSQD